MLGEPRCYFSSPPSAIDQCGGEGGSSDVSVRAARLRQSPTEPRKEETRNKKGKEVRKAGGQVDRLRRRDETRVVLTADGHRDAPPWSAPRRKTTKRNYYGTSNGR